MSNDDNLRKLADKTGYSFDILKDLVKPISSVSPQPDFNYKHLNKSTSNISPQPKIVHKDIPKKLDDDMPDDVEIMKQLFFSGQDIYDYNKNKFIENVIPPEIKSEKEEKIIINQSSIVENKQKESDIPKYNYSEKYEIKDKSPLDYLNENIGDSFLVPQNTRNFKTGVNISVHAQDNARSTEYFNRKQKFGLGYKPMTFVSEVKYDDVSKVYYHEHRETTQLNRDYPNVKFMLKRFLSEDLHLEAQNIAKKYAQILWEKKYFNALHTFPIILEQLTKQKTYWQELYEDEFIIRRNIEIAFEKKKKK